uniref:NB-ARC domain-containing protein n=1 Tax=Nicotiana tabacum TaxID=4097 RepID=A0A1S3YKC0_TOBAC|nr:PREDICTED: uncharacterized protein LOC107777222 [Nicotiana tabacum]
MANSMPGHCKTTLARKIYNDPKIPYEFFSCIWVFVGQSYIKGDIFISILKGFTKCIEEFQDKNETEIAEEICYRVANGGSEIKEIAVCYLNDFANRNLMMVIAKRKLQPGKMFLQRLVISKNLSIKGNMATFLETSKGEFSNFRVLECLESLTLLNDDTNKALHLPLAFFVYLPKLKKLTLSKTRFEWNELNRLGQLECLEVLKLEENAFTGNS